MKTSAAVLALVLPALGASSAPEGFDAFWEGVRTEAAAADVAAAARVPLASVPASGFDALGAGQASFSFELPVPGGNSASGYVVIPRNVPPGGLPLVAVFAGYADSDPTPTPRHPLWGLQGAIVAHLTTHGFPLWRDRAFYAAESDRISAGGNGGAFGFANAENESPETSYFRRIAVRDLAALRFLESLPAWDGKGLSLLGAHLGAWRAAAAAANDGAATGIAVWNPWLCNLGPDGGPRGWLPEWRPGLAFFDGAFLAAKVDVPCAIVEASADSAVNPPEGAALFHDSLAGPKSISWVRGSRSGAQRVPGPGAAAKALGALGALGAPVPAAAARAAGR